MAIVAAPCVFELSAFADWTIHHACSTETVALLRWLKPVMCVIWVEWTDRFIAFLESPFQIVENGIASCNYVFDHLFTL